MWHSMWNLWHLDLTIAMTFFIWLWCHSVKSAKRCDTVPLRKGQYCMWCHSTLDSKNLFFARSCLLRLGRTAWSQNRIIGEASISSRRKSYQSLKYGKLGSNPWILCSLFWYFFTFFYSVIKKMSVLLCPLYNRTCPWVLQKFLT